MFPSIVTRVGQAWLDDLHRQARRDGLARRARRHQHRHRVPGLVALPARWAHRDRTGPAGGSVRDRREDGGMTDAMIEVRGVVSPATCVSRVQAATSSKRRDFGCKALV